MKQKITLFLFLFIAVTLHSQVLVSTLAGSGATGSDNGKGTVATFNSPSSVVVDASGNVYVTDTNNNKIRKITPTGDVTSFVGSGNRGFANGTGNAVQFNNPEGVTMDASGNIYVTDYYNNAIRKITPAGVVSTLAGNGAAGAVDGIGTVASFNKPYGIAVDATGNLYVADYGNNKIRKIAPTGEVTTFAGSGVLGFTDGLGTAAKFNNPYGITVDATGNIYVADAGNSAIRKITPAGLVSTFAGSTYGVSGLVNGTGTVARFNTPYGITADASGNLYVADNRNSVIRKITPAGLVSTFAGVGEGSTDGLGTVARFSSPNGIAVDASGNVYVSDRSSNKIRKIVAYTCDLTATAASQTNVACNGTATGSASVVASGGAPSYTYLWAPSGGKAATASGLIAGTYRCTITDANGCQAVQSFTITQPASILNLSAVSKTDVSCNGASSGSAIVTASGGLPNYTYSWLPSGGTAATASGLLAGTYTCTVTDANGCQAVQSVTISEPSALPITISQNNIVCNGDATGSATVNVSGGTGSYTYLWAPTGGAAATASGLTAGNYSCTVTDEANGCQTVKLFIITEPSALSLVPSQTNVACTGTSTGSATVNPSGGTGGYTYLWTPSGGTAATASGLIAGIYICTVTDAKGCQAQQSFNITQPTVLSIIPSQSNVTCHGASNGSARVAVSGGSGSYIYLWSPSGSTTEKASGLITGDYICKVTDENGCVAIQNFTITEPLELLITPAQTNPTCNGSSNGSATVNVSGGTGSYTYSWAPTGGAAATASGLTAGNYSCTVTDANGCDALQSFTITNPSVLSITPSQTNVACSGTATGSATVNPSGGTGSYTYLWSPSGGTAATASGLSEGTYSCTVTDAKGCQAQQSFNITQPLAILVTSSQTDIVCHGAANGSATVTASGGTGNYTYLWAPSGGTAATVSGLIAGNYTCTVTDTNGCSAEKAINITEPIGMSFTNINLPDYDYNLPYNAQIAVTGGAGIKTYAVTSGNLPKGFSLSTDGTLKGSSIQIGQSNFILTVTDQNNCSASYNFTLKLSQIPIKVTVSASQGKAYAEKDPVLTYSVTPALLAGDSFTGALKRSSGENVGTYDIVQGSLSAGSKYLIDFTGAYFNITKAGQTITFDQNSAVGCNGETAISLTSSASSGLDINYISSNTSIATVLNNELTFKGYGSVTITSSQTGNSNYNSAPSVQLVFTRSQPHLIRKQFDNILFFDNSSKEFISYKWYKNGVLVPGQSSQHFKENGPLEGSYYAVAAKTDGTFISTCPLNLNSKTQEEYIKIAPNSVKANADYELMTNVASSKLQNARIEVFNVNGVLIDSKNADITAGTNTGESSTSLKAPSAQGIYIVKMTLTGGKYFTKNLLVRN